MRFVYLLFISMLLLPFGIKGQYMYTLNDGSIQFSSSAPNENIKASSHKLKGVIDTRKKTFAFKIDMSSFEGFNSPLQKEHFNENYMESHIFPEASFTGKIIENVSFDKNGKYTVRAKGKLSIHGVPQERIIYADILVRDKSISITSDFTVSLTEHNIKIPRVVYDKLATQINVSMNATLVIDNESK